MCIFNRKKEKKEIFSQEVKNEGKSAIETNVNHIVLIGDCIDSRAQLFDFFRDKLGKDKLLGSNLDALYDVLSTVSEDTIIELINEYHLKNSLDETYNGLISVLLDAEKDNQYIKIVRNIVDDEDASSTK